MNIDLWILAAAGVFGAIGFYTGAIQRVSHWIGIAAAALLENLRVKELLADPEMVKKIEALSAH